MKAEWKSLNDRKWEMKMDGVVLGTIYHKANDTFSVWVSTPMVFTKVPSIIADTYKFSNFDEAKAGFDKLLREKVFNWAATVLQYFHQDSV